MLALVAVILASAAVYATLQVKRIVSLHVPLADATLRIRLEVTQGHLWFEEILGGDAAEDIAVVWRHYDVADESARAMLEGGEFAGRPISALMDPDLRQAMQQVRERLASFQEVSRRRWNAAATSAAGTTVDREYDERFREIMDLTSVVETDLRILIDHDVRGFLRVMAALTVFAILAGTGAALTVYVRTRQSRRAEATLRQSERKFSTAFDASPVPMAITILADGEMIAVNQAFTRMFGNPADDPVARDIIRLDGLVNPRDKTRVLRQLREIGSVRNVEGRCRMGAEEPGWARFSADIIEIEGRECLLSVIEDITENVKANEDLLASREQLRALTTELSSIEERERRKIAAFLHDQLGQSLAVLRMKFGALQASTDRDESDRITGEIRALLEQAIEDTSTLTFELSPPILYELGIEAAVEWLGSKICEEHGLVFRFSDDGQAKPLEPDLTPLLFRISRELLLNVVKHAQARRVHLDISREGPMICLVVEDDGVGFDPGAAPAMGGPGGYGLYSIRERVQFVGGRFKIGPRIGRGTRAEVCVPLVESILSRGGA